MNEKYFDILTVNVARTIYYNRQIAVKKVDESTYITRKNNENASNIPAILIVSSITYDRVVWCI